MRNVVLSLAVSLDGFIEGPNGEFDWCFTDQDYGFSDFLDRTDAIVMGRKSYEVLKAYEGTNPWDYRNMQTFVFSKTLKEVTGDNYHLVNEDAVSFTNRLKHTDGKDIWLFGGTSLISTLMNAGLVDEFLIALHPILLGRGKPLFTDIKNRAKLKLINSQPYNTGLIMLHYSVTHTETIQTS